MGYADYDIQLDKDEIEQYIKEDSQKEGWVQKLPAVLRSLGALAVLFSLYSFLMRGWEGADDALRYLMLLGHTVLLAVLGLGSGHFLQEGKGARLLMGLSLVSVVANFAILGAFLFAAQSSMQLYQYPDYMTWSLGSMGRALYTTAGALPVLLVVIALGFMALSRGISKRMSLLFVMTNATLLIPLRDPMLVATMGSLLAFTTLFITRHTARHYVGSKTLEGSVVLMLQFLPLAVLMVRNMWLYSAEVMLVTTSLLMAFVLFRQLGMIMEVGSRMRGILNDVSVLVALFSGISIGASLLEVHAAPAWAIFCGTVLSSALSYEVGCRDGRQQGFYRVIAALLMALGLLLNLLLNMGLLSAVMALCTGLLMLLVSYQIKQRSMLWSGMVLLLAGMLYLMGQVFNQFELGSWAILAMVGVCAILIGSMLESRGGRIKPLLLAWRSRYADWVL